MSGFGNEFASEDPRCPGSLPEGQVTTLHLRCGLKFEPHHDKFYFMSYAQSDQHLCCSLPRWYNTYTCFSQNFKTLASFFSWACQVESYLVGTPQRQVFSRHGSFSILANWMSLFVIKGVSGYRNFMFEPPHDKTNKTTFAPSEDSDQPGHLPRLFRVFAVHMKKQGPQLLLSALRRLWSDWAVAQADLSLRWPHRPFCWFCHEAAHLEHFLVFKCKQCKPWLDVHLIWACTVCQCPFYGIKIFQIIRLEEAEGGLLDCNSCGNLANLCIYGVVLVKFILL